MFTPAPLTYRFGCKFADGTTYRQPADDHHPVLPGRNAYYELLQKDPNGNPIKSPNDDWLLPRTDIVEFWVEGPGHHCSVNLRRGTFKHNGALLITEVSKPVGAKLSLVWFRRHQVHQNIGVLRDGNGEIYESPIEYHLGWQCYVDGQKYEQTVVIT